VIYCAPAETGAAGARSRQGGRFAIGAAAAEIALTLLRCSNPFSLGSEVRRIISFRRARDAEGRRYRALHG
jgi:uncharacterized DUF497 family protein